ncbi:hypothetical protein [Afipia sp. DC4300-2b1]|uniref:hypothetical protein n=1 Tax=Afipia sp. DC4300-2b1 TaxID=2804672 RepID=UPI003CF1874A
MDIFFFQLVIIFIPGIIWERVDCAYGREHPKEQWDVIRRSFVFGLASYGVLYGVAWVLGCFFGDLGLKMPQLKKEEAFLDISTFREIVLASLVAVICSILWLYVTNYKLVTRLLQKIGATKRYGDEDIWEFMFNSRRAEVEYVHLRDFDKKLAYAGWVEAFSESEKQREIVLRDVNVFDFDGNLIMETARVYLARKAENIDIEFPYRATIGEGDDK